MKITIYELLGLIKYNKAPMRVKHIDLIWEYDKEVKDYVHNDLYLIYSMNSKGLTEGKIEIVDIPKEEKKIPEKLKRKDFLDNFGGLAINDDKFIDKINEIIDYLNKKEV